MIPQNLYYQFVQLLDIMRCLNEYYMVCQCIIVYVYSGCLCYDLMWCLLWSFYNFFLVLGYLFGHLPCRVVHSTHQVDLGLGVLGRFEIGLCVHIVLYIIINYFWSRVRLDSFVSRINFGLSGLFWTLLNSCRKNSFNNLLVQCIDELN